MSGSIEGLVGSGDVLGLSSTVSASRFMATCCFKGCRREVCLVLLTLRLRRSTKRSIITAVSQSRGSEGAKTRRMRQRRMLAVGRSHRRRNSLICWSTWKILT